MTQGNTSNTGIAANDEPTRYLLPTVAYTAATWLEREIKHVFSHQWLLACGSDELSDIGSYQGLTVGGIPVLLIRGDDGQLRAFHNLCSHRGMRLLQGTGRVASAIVCDYHCWRFALDGTLLVIPQRDEQFAGVELGQLGLQPIPTATWAGLTFINVGADPMPFDQWRTGTDEWSGDLDAEALSLVAAVDIPIDCNWKIAVENHIDIYHLWYLHSDTFKIYNHRRYEQQQVGEHWFSWEPLREPEPGSTGTYLYGQLGAGLSAHLLFPNTLIIATPDFIATYAPEPITAHTCVLRLRVRARTGADPSELLATVRAVLDQDVRICAELQAGHLSPSWKVGPLAATHELPIEDFHIALRSSLADAE